ncbi:1-deoxy-D-xylulose-5-phosphate synthase N-terminal domain-containing protein [Pseudomonas protegens]|uniref:1-deoxy-D-xylulose-5-phosphate synthase N-terminal domain-containing protein n=1 Tax=Pseudomonas protegens TaxID=380021 RepID=UPI00381910FA
MNQLVSYDLEPVASLLTPLYGIRQSVHKRKAYLTADEYVRANEEVEVGIAESSKCQTINELSVAIARQFTPFYSDVRGCLERIHEIVGYGTLASCLSSLNIAEALFALELCNAAGVANQDLVIGRGHIAPLFYAYRHVLNGMPLAFLAAVHDKIPAVVNKHYGFAYSMRHSLGEGVGIALGRANTNRDARVICVAGDGELNEGVSFEAIRLIGELEVKNLTLIVDNNGRGIDPLPGKLKPEYLAAYFSDVYEVDGHDTQAISEHVRQAEKDHRSAAIICHTEKGVHSFKRASHQSLMTSTDDQQKNDLRKASSCSRTADIIEEVRSGAPAHVFTADLAARFGLKSLSGYCNTGLAESALLTCAMGCPDDELKFVLTDDKYYLNAIDVLHSALIACRNLHVIGARKNGVWGGATYASTVFSLLTEETVYELTDPLDLLACIHRQKALGGNGLYLMYDQPMERVCALREKYRKLSEDIYIFQPEFAAGSLIVSSESMAYEAFQVATTKRCTHIRFLSVRPDLELVKEMLSQCAEIIVVEHNSGRFNLAEYIESRLLVRVRKVFGDAYEWPTIETFQANVASRALDALLADSPYALVN